MPIFDFHIHPSLKELLAPPSLALTPWDNIAVKLNVGKLFGHETQVGINSVFNQALNSQANLTQLHKGGVDLAGVALYAIEKNIARGVLARKIVANNSIHPLDPDILQQIQHAPSYYTWLKKNMDSLLQNSVSPDGKLRFQFINSMQDYRPGSDTIHGICLVEGLHCFMDDPYAPGAEESFHINLTDFRERYKVRVFAINAAHMQAVPFYNHAYGMQFIQDPGFVPDGNGITDAGMRIIRHLYEQNILVDLKHLSLNARRQLISFHKEHYPDRPIICTHAGLTGLSVRNRLSQLYEKPRREGGHWEVKHMKRRGTVDHSAFNHSSINLYDEEVVEILRSGGLFGLSMDQRILGYPGEDTVAQAFLIPTDREIISDLEAGFFFRPYTNPKDASVMQDTDAALTADEAQEQESDSPQVHYDYFINQLLHFLRIAKQARFALDKAAEQICIGSDYDGLINPIDCCLNAASLPAFKDELTRLLKRGRKIWDRAGIAKSSVDIDKLIEGLFYQNGVNFLKKMMP